MPDGGDGRPARRGSRLLRACLWAWPRGRRRSHGAPLLEAAEALLDDARRAGRLRLARELAAEAAALVWTGLALRAEAVSEGVRGGASGWLAELRLALRGLRRSPGFTLVAAATLALGIGGNAAVFGLVDGVLLAEPPYGDPDRLVLVWNTLPGSPERVPMAGPDVAVVRERSRTLDGVAFVGRAVDGAVEEGSGAAEHVRLAAVTPDLFEVLRVAPALGRGFVAADAAGPAAGEGAPVSVAVLSHEAWRRLFGGDPAVVGRDVRLNGLPVRVVGVMPPGFRVILPPGAGVGTDVDVWTPLLVPLTAFHRDGRLLDRDSDNTGAVVARLAPGATVADARAEAAAIAADLRAEVSVYAAADLGMDVRSLQADAAAHARPILLALLAGAAAVLVVACLDVAGLLVARGAGRSGEMAVRAALGAGRGRLARQLLAEGLALVAVGTGLSLLLAPAAAAALGRAVPPGLAPAGGASAHVPALALAASAAAATVLAASLAPLRRVAALEGRGAVAAALSRRWGGGGGVRRALVGGEVALAVVLVLGAGLLLRTVAALQQARPGFEPSGALTFDVSLRVPGRYAGPADRAAFMDAVASRVAALPGVEAVGWVGGLPLGGERWTQPYGLPGQAPSEWEANRADFRVASSGYFEALGARLLEGRAFTAREDLHEDARVVVVDERLARRVAPRGSAVGAVLGLPVDGAPVEARVVGVVEHVRHESLDADGREAVWVPYRQEASREVSFVVRTTADPSALAAAVREAVRAEDPQVPVHDLRTLEAYVATAVAPRRFALTLLAAFAGLALVCAALGLYGVVAFDVRRRTRDLGVRMAVGASPDRVVRHVLGAGLRLSAGGVAAGLLLAAAAAPGLRAVVYGVGVADPATWGVGVAVVALTTLLACWLPARRASRLDPAEALRAD